MSLRNSAVILKRWIKLFNCHLDFDSWTVALIVCMQDRRWLVYLCRGVMSWWRTIDTVEANTFLSTLTLLTGPESRLIFRPRLRHSSSRHQSSLIARLPRSILLLITTKSHLTSPLHTSVNSPPFLALHTTPFSSTHQRFLKFSVTQRNRLHHGPTVDCSIHEPGSYCCCNCST